jgi:hypothetical protein
VHVGPIFIPIISISSNLDLSSVFCLDIALSIRGSSAWMCQKVMCISLKMWTLMKQSTLFSKLHPNTEARLRQEISLLPPVDRMVYV